MSADLFGREDAVLSKLAGYAASQEATDAEREAAKAYAKLLKMTKRLMRLSDRNEAELNAMADRERAAAAEVAEQRAAFEALAQKLSRYLAPQVYQSIFSGQQDTNVSGKRKKLTVFFSDLAQFTMLTDKLEAEDLTTLLNRYMTEMSEIALARGATIDKFIGDAIMIFFGDPETGGVQQDAKACVEMAVEMQNRLTELNAEWLQLGLEAPLQARMGINTGYCTVGNFGGHHRVEYTIIGGAVNLAARLEKAAAPGRILMSHTTWALVGDTVPCRASASIDVKGIAYPVQTYEVSPSVLSDSVPIDETRDAFRIFVDPAAMTDEVQTEAIALLRESIARLSAR